MRTALGFALALLACSACDGRATVLLRISANGALAGIDRIECSVDNAGQHSEAAVFPLPHVTIPPEQTIALVFDRDRRGPFQVEVVAVGDGIERARASGTGSITPGALTEVSVVLPGALDPICLNGAQDPGESDVDCGGPCPACDVGRTCLLDADCQTARCDGLCALVSGPPGWLPAPDYPGPSRQEFGVAGLDDGVYLVGGIGGVDTLVYRPFDAKWEVLANGALPSERYFVGVAGHDHVLVAVGGDGPRADVLTLTIGAGTWTASVPLPVAGSERAVGFVGLDLYAVGGLGPAIALGADVLRAGAAAWTPAPAPIGSAFVLYEHTVVVAGDAIYRIGGTTAEARAILRLAATGSEWEPLATSSNPHTQAMSALGSDGRIYAGGGEIGSIALSDVEAYTPSVDRWTKVAAFPEVRLGGAAAQGPDGRIYVVGGATPAVSATTIAYGPRFAVTPDPAAPQAVVELTGDNFATNATVAVAIDGRAGDLASGATDATGALIAPLAFTLPVDLAPGTYRIRAVDDRSRYPVFARLRVQ